MTAAPKITIQPSKDGTSHVFTFEGFDGSTGKIIIPGSNIDAAKLRLEQILIDWRNYSAAKRAGFG